MTNPNPTRGEEIEVWWAGQTFGEHPSASLAETIDSVIGEKITAAVAEARRTALKEASELAEMVIAWADRISPLLKTYQIIDKARAILKESEAQPGETVMDIMKDLGRRGMRLEEEQSERRLRQIVKRRRMIGRRRQRIVQTMKNL